MLRILILFIFCLCFSAESVKSQENPPPTAPTPTTSPNSQKANRRPSAAAPSEPFENATVAALAKQCVKFETEAGVFEAEMFPEAAPETVRNFLNLAAIGAFDTTVFSRVIPNFVVQGGNVSTRLTSTPEIIARMQRTIPDEPNQILHERGILSMARSTEPNTATSHFFILVREATHLNGTFAAFGRIINGMDIVDAINKMPGTGERPTKPVRLNRATVAACPAKETPRSATNNSLNQFR